MPEGILEHRPTVGITMGDPAGIGPEICVKAVTSGEVQAISRPIVIGDFGVMKHAVKIAKVGPVELNSIKKVEDAKFGRGIIDILDLQNITASKIKTGKVSPECGRAAYEYIQKAIDLALAKKIDAIATAPINKEALAKAGVRYHGHTEMLAARTKTDIYRMMFISDSLWIMLVTTHIPIREIHKHLDKKKILETIKLANEVVQKLKKKKKPKIGVAGFNPHAGEAGIFGDEEKKIIRPAVEEAQRAGIDVQGPISPDAIFYLANVGMFDMVVAMYHDQGLIPLKLLSFNRSVNVTAGLPIIRTSVDHGTGFDIAGKGWANPTSLIQAIKVAALMCQA